MIYTIHLCPDEGDLVYVSTIKGSIAEAMERAVDLAFVEGAKPGPIRGRFICIQDDKGDEVFRTPFARA